MASDLATITKKLESETQNFQSLQKEFNQAVESRTKLEAQLRENEAVQKEFDILEEDSNIYKLVGPVLVKQDSNEAKTNVSKRIDFIKKEIERVEIQIKLSTDKQNKKREEMAKLQAQFQQAQTQKK